jgi:hypothetical protein
VCFGRNVSNEGFDVVAPGAYRTAPQKLDDRPRADVGRGRDGAGARIEQRRRDRRGEPDGHGLRVRVDECTDVARGPVAAPPAS